MQAVAAPSKLKPNCESARISCTRLAFIMQAVATPTKLKAKRESYRRRSHRAAFTMQAVAAPRKMKPKRKSARGKLHTRRIHNASGGRPNKIKTQTRISPKTVAHAPHSQCDRGRLHQKSKRKPFRRRSQTRRIHNASGSNPNNIEIQTQISSKTFAHAPH